MAGIPSKVTGQRLPTDAGCWHSKGARSIMLRRNAKRFFGTIILACVSMRCTNASNVVGSGGSPACPCIDTSVHPWKQLMTNSEEIIDGTLVLRALEGGSMGGAANTSKTYFPRDYGSTNCTTHDNRSRLCREALEADPPWLASGPRMRQPDGELIKWCLDRWCYVNPNNCQVRLGSDSSLLQQDTKISMLFGEGSMHFSYETCGFTNRYTVKDRAAVLKAEISALPSILIGTPGWGTDDFMRRRGMTFLRKVLTSMGVTEDKIVLLNVSDRSLALKDELFSGSSWTACVHDVAIGLVDACGPMFLDLPIRRRLGPMVRMTSMPMYIMGKKIGEETFWTLVEKPFKPFTWPLWVMLAMVALMVGCVMGTVEYTIEESRDTSHASKTKNARERHTFETDDSFERQISYGSGASDGSRSRGLQKIHDHAVTLGGYMHSLVQAFDFAAGASYRPKTSTGKLISAGYSFFVLVVVASYTANTTVFLFEERLEAEFTSIEDAIQRNIRICIPAKLFEPMLTSRYPDIRRTWVRQEDWKKKAKNVFDAFQKGECKAIIEAEFVLQDKHGKGEFCDVETIGGPVHSYGWGYPIRKAILPHVSWGILEAEIKGDFINVEKTFPPPQSKCRRADGKTADEEGVGQLDTKHFLGAVILVIMSVTIAVGGRFLRWLLKASPKAERRITQAVDGMSNLRLSGSGAARSTDSKNHDESGHGIGDHDDPPTDVCSHEFSAGGSTQKGGSSKGAELAAHGAREGQNLTETSCFQGVKAVFSLSQESRYLLRKCIDEAVQKTVSPEKNIQDRFKL